MTQELIEQPEQPWQQASSSDIEVTDEGSPDLNVTVDDRDDQSNDDDDDDMTVTVLEQGDGMMDQTAATGWA